MSDFAKCPFCGESNQIQACKDTSLGGKAYAMCWGCMTRGPQADEEEDATKLWNTRWVKVEL